VSENPLLQEIVDAKVKEVAIMPGVPVIQHVNKPKVMIKKDGKPL
jgi:hypothetical protein